VQTVLVVIGNGNEAVVKMGMGTKYGYGNEMGMGKKSREWDEIGIKILFLHTSILNIVKFTSVRMCRGDVIMMRWP